MSNSPPMKGPTKFFFDDENLDRVYGMVMATGAEISKLDEKLETILDLMEQKGVFTREEYRNHEPTADQQSIRDATRAAFVESLLAPLRLEADALASRSRS
jgi:hypothetical protein